MIDKTQRQVRVTVWMFALLVGASLLGPSAKVIPGGPFVSIRGDVLCPLVALCSIIVGLRAYRDSPQGRRIVILLLSGLAALIIAEVALNVVLFATDRYARGELVAW